MDLFHLALTAALAPPVAYICTPASMALARRLGAIDIPDAARKRHARPTPRLGGLALLAALTLTSLLSFDRTIVAPLLSSGLLVCAVGVCDDSLSAPPLAKLACQSAAALVAATLSRPLGDSPDAVLLSAFWICAMINAFNLIDGSDGLAAGQGAVSGALCAAFALAAPLVGQMPTDRAYPIALAALSLSGACLGFLPYNRARASVFLGDSGAMLIGCSLSQLALAFGASLAPIVALATCSLPLLELVSSVTRRAAAGAPLFCADRGHIHHRLADRGFSPHGIAILLALSSFAFGCLLLLLTLSQNYR